MNTQLKLVGTLFISLLLVGGLLTSVQMARADSEAPPSSDSPVSATAAQGLETTLATTLTISIPDMAIAPDGGRKVVDLWDYTTYDDDKVVLVFTPTQTSGQSYLVTELMDGHYLSMTSISSITPRYADIEVEVGDGDLYDSTMFEVELNNPPELDFFPGGLNDLPNPVYVNAGEASVLTLDDGETEVPLENYAYDEEDPYGSGLTFAIANSPPISLGVSIFTQTDENHYVAFDPDPELIGTYPVEVQVQDTVGLTGTDTFTVTVLQRVFLPLAVRNHPLIPTLQSIDNSDGDGLYWLQWSVPGEGYHTYELQYALNSEFTGATTILKSTESYEAFTIAPNTYYWRVRVQAKSGEPENPWSNVQSVTVGNFAYLYVEPLCAYGLRIELFGNNNYSQEYGTEYCNQTVYWRSVPVGTYTTRLTWIGGSIVENVPATALGNDEYKIRAGDYPNSQWQEY